MFLEYIIRSGMIGFHSTSNLFLHLLLLLLLLLLHFSGKLGEASEIYPIS